jgi:desulfoferrodoxin (superoxide reductase-like protein)
MGSILKLFLILFISSSIIFVFGDDKNKYGKEITLEEKTQISDILSNPEDYLDETVLIEGEVLDVCPKMGCWMEIKSDVEGEKIKIKVKDGEIVFPEEAEGHMALIEGKVYKIELSKEEAISYYEHHAEEKGEAFDPSTITEAVTIYQIKGIGAEIEKE